jgi:hypothetical protein
MSKRRRPEMPMPVAPNVDDHLNAIKSGNGTRPDDSDSRAGAEIHFGADSRASVAEREEAGRYDAVGRPPFSVQSQVPGRLADITCAGSGRFTGIVRTTAAHSEDYPDIREIMHAIRENADRFRASSGARSGDYTSLAKEQQQEVSKDLNSVTGTAVGVVRDGEGVDIVNLGGRVFRVQANGPVHELRGRVDPTDTSTHPLQIIRYEPVPGERIVAIAGENIPDVTADQVQAALDDPDGAKVGLGKLLGINPDKQTLNALNATVYDSSIPAGGSTEAQVTDGTHAQPATDETQAANGQTEPEQEEVPAPITVNDEAATANDVISDKPEPDEDVDLWHLTDADAHPRVTAPFSVASSASVDLRHLLNETDGGSSSEGQLPGNASDEESAHAGEDQVYDLAKDTAEPRKTSDQALRALADGVDPENVYDRDALPTNERTPEPEVVATIVDPTVNILAATVQENDGTTLLGSTVRDPQADESRHEAPNAEAHTVSGYQPRTDLDERRRTGMSTAQRITAAVLAGGAGAFNGDEHNTVTPSTSTAEGLTPGAERTAAEVIPQPEPQLPAPTDLPTLTPGVPVPSPSESTQSPPEGGNPPPPPEGGTKQGEKAILGQTHPQTLGKYSEEWGRVEDVEENRDIKPDDARVNTVVAVEHGANLANGIEISDMLPTTQFDALSTKDVEFLAHLGAVDSKELQAFASQIQNSETRQLARGLVELNNLNQATKDMTEGEIAQRDRKAWETYNRITSGLTVAQQEALTNGLHAETTASLANVINGITQSFQAKDQATPKPAPSPDSSAATPPSAPSADAIPEATGVQTTDATLQTGAPAPDATPSPEPGTPPTPQTIQPKRSRFGRVMDFLFGGGM